MNQRAGERGNSSQSWVKNTNMTDWISSLQTLFYEGLCALTLTRFHLCDSCFLNLSPQEGQKIVHFQTAKNTGDNDNAESGCDYAVLYVYTIPVYLRATSVIQ